MARRLRFLVLLLCLGVISIVPSDNARAVTGPESQVPAATGNPLRVTVCTAAKILVDPQTNEAITLPLNSVNMISRSLDSQSAVIVHVVETPAGTPFVTTTEVPAAGVCRQDRDATRGYRVETRVFGFEPKAWPTGPVIVTVTMGKHRAQARFVVVD